MRNILKTSLYMSLCAGLLFSMSACEQDDSALTDDANAKQAEVPFSGVVSCDDEIHPTMTVTFCPLECGNGVWGDFWMVEQGTTIMIDPWIWQTDEGVVWEASKESNEIIEEEPPGPKMFLPLEVCDYVNMEFRQANSYQVSYEPIPDRPQREACENSPQSYTAIRIYSIEPIGEWDEETGWE